MAADGFVAWADGRLVAAGEATVSVFDRAFRTGEGVFETMRTYAGAVFRLDAHLARAAAGAEVVGFDLPDLTTLAQAVRETADANQGPAAGRDLAVRLTATPGRIDPASPHPGRPASGAATVVITAQPLELDDAVYRRGVAAITVPWARAIASVKSVSYLPATLALRAARRDGAHEAILCDSRGMLLEGAGSNLFAVVGERLVTAPVDAGVLPGVTRAVVLELAAAGERPVELRVLAPRQLIAADEAFLTSSTRELVPLVALDGQEVGSGRPGPVTAALHAAYRAAVAEELGTSG